VLLPVPAPGSVTPELEGALSGAAVKEVKSVDEKVVEGSVWPIEVNTDESDETPTGGDVATGEGIDVVNGAATGSVDVEAVVATGGLAPTPTDDTGAVVGPDPTPRSVPVGLTPTDNSGAVVGPTPAPIRGPEVGATPSDRRGAVVGPTPTPSRGPEVGATPSERRGSEVGPTANPSRAPPSAADEVPESPPRTGERRPLAALSTPPRRPLSAADVAV
jgi:hypothetical protein